MTLSSQEILSGVDQQITDALQRPDEWVPPLGFDLSNSDEKQSLQSLFDKGKIEGVIDNLDSIVGAIFSLRYPDLAADEDARAEFMADFLDNPANEGNNYGTWFYFPWNKQLVRYPSYDDHLALRTARNKLLITEDEQKRIYNSTIAVFGLSVGSSIVEQLVMGGIGNKLILADSDTLDPTNLNRINGDFTQVGSSKISRLARKISMADPYIEQVHMSEGVTEENIDPMIAEHSPELMFDEIDNLPVKALIRERARRYRIPVIMATDVADTSLIDVERYDNAKPSYFNGRLHSSEFDTLRSDSLSNRERKKMMAKLIGLRNVTPRLIDSVLKIDKEIPGLPQLGTTASMGGALGAVTAREILLSRSMPSGRYSVSARKTLKLKPHTSRSQSLKIGRRFVQSRREKI